MNRVYTLVLLVGATLLGAGCGKPFLSLNVFVVDEQTALERQVLGAYQEIGRELSTYASVRGVNPDGSLRPAPEITNSQRAVLQAMNNRRYNRDDIDALLASGVIGEGRDGRLVIREETPPANLGMEAALVRQVVDEDNADRDVIVERLVRTTPGVTEKNRSQIVEIFAGLNREIAPPGTMIEDAEGNWSAKR